MEREKLSKEVVDDFRDSAMFFWMVEGMDLPPKRVQTRDYQWLIRNAGIRNANHPNYNELMEFLKRKTADSP